jgi:dinuclear metal center YbgI/SA1388 family protein
MKAQRIRTLLEADISLFAYHLPLDCHPTLGNNAGLARAMGLPEWQGIDPENATHPVFCGAFDEGTRLSDIVGRLEHELGREALVVGDPDAFIRSAAWCTGGGQGYIDEAASYGAELFITGEVSEQTVHVARERDLAFVAAGHHATERFGARSVGQWIAERFGIDHHFVDIDNPA